MTLLIIISVVIGILAGLWAVAAVQLNLIIFAGFMAWSTFFAAGGKLSGLKSSLITNLSGVVWGVVIMALSDFLGPSLGQLPGLGMAVAIGAAGMCLQSKFALLEYMPGTFIGCATYFGANFDFSGTVIALGIGGILGYISEALYTKLDQVKNS